MSFTNEQLDELFENEYFQQKVLELLNNRLSTTVKVSNGADFFTEPNQVQVEVGLRWEKDTYEHERWGETYDTVSVYMPPQD